MESTPLSTRRITRSLASSAQKSANQTQPRAALYDITNDSPIVGLAAGGLVVDRTPQASAAGAKSRARPRRTPGSGEALLRGQVKTLLQKVDEEVIRPVRVQALLGIARSPAQLLAPTPANTPQLGLESAAREDIVMLSEGLIPKLQIIAGSLPLPPSAAEEENLVESQLSRALVFDDSPGKSGLSNEEGSAVSSSLKLQGSSSSSDISHDDDSSSSVWSTQVNVGSEAEEVSENTMGELEEGYKTEEEPEGEEEYDTDEDWEDDDDDECFDELCEGMSKMAVVDHQEEEKKKKTGLLLAFQGTHTRFVYNSDDEIVERKEVANAAAEHDALLRGMQVPEGKHLRFQDDDDE